MKKKFRVYKQLDLPTIEKEVLAKWTVEKTFAQSIANRDVPLHGLFMRDHLLPMAYRAFIMYCRAPLRIFFADIKQ